MERQNCWDRYIFVWKLSFEMVCYRSYRDQVSVLPGEGEKIASANPNGD